MSLPQTLVRLIKTTIFEPIVGAEIGVYKGTTSKELLRSFPTLFLHLVDPWKEWEFGSSYRTHKRTGNLYQDEWDDVYRSAIHNVFPYEDRYKIHRMTSEEAVTHIKDKSLCLCFVDSDHTYEMVKQDIKLWLPKVRDGGLIVFHDYGGRYKGVKKAVDEVFKSEDLILPGYKVCGVIV